MAQRSLSSRFKATLHLCFLIILYNFMEEILRKLLRTINPKARLTNMRRLNRRMKIIYRLCLLCTLTVILIILCTLMRKEDMELMDWPRNRSRSVQSYMNPDLEPLIFPADFCKKQFYLLIIVHSHPLSFEARSVIRRTWGSPAELGVHNNLVFLIGETRHKAAQKHIQHESAIFRDIIQERFEDSYANLSLKSVFMLKVVSACSNAKFLMKADTDLYVNTRGILRLCTVLPGFSYNLLVGRYLGLEKPVRDPLSKYYVPRYLYEGEAYPPFVAGTGYVMSMDVAEKLYLATLATPLFHLEDVYITGICAKAAGVRHLQGYYFTNVGLPQDLCLFLELHVAHSLSPSMIHSLYAIRTDLERICLYQKESRKRGH